MRPRLPVTGRGTVSGTGIIIIGLLATLAALIFPVWSYADRSGPGVTNAATLRDGTVSTRYGPLSALDRDFVTQVRLAGLWELPAGQEAERKGTTQTVRTAGQHLVDGHAFLDQQVRETAAKLSLQLPNEPTTQQKEWLGTLDTAQGTDYDRTFVNLLRVADGRLLPLVSQVRATTRNSLVRSLADDAGTTVLEHIQVLEATGDVDWNALAGELASSVPQPTDDPPGPTADPRPAVPLPAPSATGQGSPSPTYALPPPASSAPPRQQS
jgi:predicted outer membrane protein